MKKNIRYILLTMIIAILGVLVFQIYWITNTYDVQTKAFNQEVDLALEKVLKEDIANKTITRMLGGQIVQTDTTLSGSSGPLKLEWRYQEYYQEEHWVIVGENAYYTLQPDELLDLFGSAMVSVVQKRPDLKEVAEHYQAELLSRGIHAHFDLAFAVQDLIIESSNNDPSAFVDATIKQKIPGRQPDELLMAVFPSSNSIILRRMWLTLLGSFLLFGLFAGSFFLMLQTIFKKKRVSEIKNDFINNMTHEFKTPISTVSAAMEALVSFNGLDDRERSLRYIDVSQKEIKRLGSLVEKVLSLSVFEQKKVSLNKETFDLCRLLHETAQQYIMKGNGAVSIAIDAESGAYIYADRLHFQNVVNNLLDNAVKYAHETVEIVVKCSREGDFIVLTVKDNGIGISKDQQKHIFEKFYRVPTGDLHGVKGFGLGLSYVKHIVELHGGTVGVKSQPGVGSEFIIAIPDIHD